VLSLDGVSCVSVSSCEAVGNYSSNSLGQTLIESWNGTVWSVVPGPGPSVAYLYGVSCVSARSCKATGEYAKQQRRRPDPCRVLERHRLVNRA